MVLLLENKQPIYSNIIITSDKNISLWEINSRSLLRIVFVMRWFEIEFKFNVSIKVSYSMRKYTV